MKPYKTLTEACEYLSKKHGKPLSIALMRFYIKRGLAPKYETIMGRKAFIKEWLDKWEWPTFSRVRK